MESPRIENHADMHINPDFVTELTDEVKCISYALTCIGESVETSGVPSDTSIFNQTMAKLAYRLDCIAETLEEVGMDLIEKEKLNEDRDQIRIIVKHPGEDPFSTSFDGSLNALQKIVNGYIAAEPFEGFCVVCSESVPLNRKSLCCEIEGKQFYGTVVLIGTDPDDEFIDVDLDVLNKI